MFKLHGGPHQQVLFSTCWLATTDSKLTLNKENIIQQ